MNSHGYPIKIVLAWAEAVSGNEGIRTWLMENGYPELGLFVHALNNQDEARTWLMQNGFPHLMALINGPCITPLRPVVQSTRLLSMRSFNGQGSMLPYRLS